MSSSHSGHVEASLATQNMRVAEGDSMEQQVAASEPLSGSKPNQTLKTTHQRFVFADPVAFRYLEEDPSTTVLERRHRLQGYELYLVEQWACSRVHPTFVITTYTGDPSHSVVVGVLSIPADEETWSPRLRLYFKAMSQYHARRRETSLGVMMVTNLSGFPSALTVIPVPDGDIKKHREDFIVNEDLKRLGCSGRAGLSLSPPSDATQAKFYQLYKASDLVQFYGAVIELVKLCQVALMMFAKLGPEYGDGLLCDVTERAINEWWSDLGAEIYNAEPRDGILGPTTVAGLLGMFIGARNRLSAYGAPVAKDAFDVGCLKRGIGYFQKAQKLPRTNRLDRHTLDRLHRATAKAASGEGWMLPKTVKSTMAELSGKGGEMVLGRVGSRDKAGIAEIETLDIELFVQLVQGERCKWLWYGKPKKGFNHKEAEFGIGTTHPASTKGAQENFLRSDKRRHSIELGRISRGANSEDTAVARHGPDHEMGSGADGSATKDAQLRRTVLKSMTGRINDARSGFERIRGAVGITGLRGHYHRLSKEDSTPVDPGANLASYADTNESVSATSLFKSAPSSGRSSLRKVEMDVVDVATPIRSRMEKLKKEKEAESLHSISSHVRSDSIPSHDSKPSPASSQARDLPQSSPQGSGQVKSDIPLSEKSAPDQAADGIRPDKGDALNNTGVILERTQSHSAVMITPNENHSSKWWPRHMSFSAAEEAVLTWTELDIPMEDINPEKNRLADMILREKVLTEQVKQRYHHALQLRDETARWVKLEVAKVQELEAQTTHDQDELHQAYHRCLNEHQTVQVQTDRVLAESRSQVVDAIRDVDVLGAKLDYEVTALMAKVEDVEEGVQEFDRQVFNLELKIREFEAHQQAGEGWVHWAVRMLTGIGNTVSTSA